MVTLLTETKCETKIESHEFMTFQTVFNHKGGAVAMLKTKGARKIKALN